MYSDSCPYSDELYLLAYSHLLGLLLQAFLVINTTVLVDPFQNLSVPNK
jgi:hypothetical protein